VKDEKIAISGWLETSNLWLKDFLQDFVNHGIKYCICTDISKDGLLKGASNELYEKTLDEFKELQLIASGGVSNMADLEKLAEIGCFGAIVGKAIYEGKVTLKELMKFS
jgi:phosphoribosylformimino-5-aminoimidazole carboxamide ribotide isomerase